MYTAERAVQNMPSARTRSPCPPSPPGACHSAGDSVQPFHPRKPSPRQALCSFAGSFHRHLPSPSSMNMIGVRRQGNWGCKPAQGSHTRAHRTHRKCVPSVPDHTQIMPTAMPMHACAKQIASQLVHARSDQVGGHNAPPLEPNDAPLNSTSLPSQSTNHFPKGSR